MNGALDILTRGVDSSGRLVKGTRQFFQFYDRVNREAAEGRLVIVQGGFMGGASAIASASTHRLAMCADFRTWNLSTHTRNLVVVRGRNLMGTMWYRTWADGMDPHIHNNLIGDHPADSSAVKQVVQYRAGRNGLANNLADRNPYRPSHIHDYVYLEDFDMFEESDRQLLREINRKLDKEKQRDANERERDKKRFRRLIGQMGAQADDLSLLINSTKDAATKKQLRRMKEKILLALKEDPDVTEEDNPSDDALAEENMG